MATSQASVWSNILLNSQLSWVLFFFFSRKDIDISLWLYHTAPLGLLPVCHAWKPTIYWKFCDHETAWSKTEIFRKNGDINKAYKWIIGHVRYLLLCWGQDAVSHAHVLSRGKTWTTSELCNAHAHFNFRSSHMDWPRNEWRAHQSAEIILAEKSRKPMMSLHGNICNDFFFVLWTFKEKPYVRKEKQDVWLYRCVHIFQRGYR